MTTKIRTTNWNVFNHYPKTKPPAKLEPWVRKAEIVKRRLKKIRDKIAHPMACATSRRFGKTTEANRIYRILLEESTLLDLKHGLATNNRKVIKRAIDNRINLRGKISDYRKGFEDGEDAIRIHTREPSRSIRRLAANGTA